MINKIWIRIPVTFVLMFLIISQVKSQELIWSDEFNVDGRIDSEKWHHQTLLPNGSSWYNGEIQHYTDRIENSYVSNGTLKIMAIRENYTQQGITKEFTSARLNSKFAFTYGRVEISARLPMGIGTWPALWTLGQNITEPGGYFAEDFGTTPWPACGEIDIMEHWGSNQNYILSATHTPSSYGGTVNAGGRYIDNVSNQFHLYSLDWDEDKLTFAVDNQIHYVYEPSQQNWETWPFDLNQYLLLNVAILPEIIPTGFTQDAMEIDYVRVYQNNLNDVSLDTADKIKIAPIPTNDIIRISGIKTSTIYSILDYSGIILKKGLLNSNNHSINLTDLSTGMYFLQLNNKDGYIITEKIIVK